MPPSESDLGSAELEVLRTLWDLGPLTVRDVMNQLHERGRRVAYTTVLTFLTRLEQKGFVRSDKSGVAYVYRPKISREKVTKSRLRSLISELYDGAAAPMILQLVREQPLTRDEIAELQQLIDKLDDDAPPAKRKRGRS